MFELFAPLFPIGALICRLPVPVMTKSLFAPTNKSLVVMAMVEVLVLARRMPLSVRPPVLLGVSVLPEPVANCNVLPVELFDSEKVLPAGTE